MILMQNYPDVTVADGHPRFVVDRSRLTGGGISSGLDEALKLIELLSGTAAAQDVQQTTQYIPIRRSRAIPNTLTPDAALSADDGVIPLPLAGGARGGRVLL